MSENGGELATARQDSIPENHIIDEDNDMETSFDPKGVRVLAVDDNIVCLNVLLAMLKKCGYKFTGTTDVAEALRLLRENKDEFDLVITDAQTHQMMDFYLLSNVRNEFDIPILVLSASQETEDVIKAVSYGAKDYISKPPRLDVINNIWQHVLRKYLFSDRNNNNAEQFSKSSEEQNHQKDAKDEANNESESDSVSKCINHKKKKARINWTGALQRKFVGVIQKLGKDAKPKQILMSMNEPGLTIQKVSNYLQVYKRRLKNDSGQIDPFSNQNSSLFHLNMTLNQKLLHPQIMRSDSLQQSYNLNQEMHLAPPVPYCSGGGDVNLALQKVYGVGSDSQMNDHIFTGSSSQFSPRPIPMMQQQQPLVEDLLAISYLGKDDQVRMPLSMYDGTDFQNCESSLQSTLYEDPQPQFPEGNQMPLPIQAPLAGQYDEFDLPVYTGQVDYTDEQMNGLSSGMFEDQDMYFENM